eukprot:TRINITY_DN5895_c0_g1_i1.p1 TRINITY_DN5895_c0_g1~~TRINITY_DN5895_c0_g1_i1.p1  ORF type:complete len:120 (+),score=19.28 TRINITY_DN5895_c0_g1_i1:59-418(+)
MFPAIICSPPSELSLPLRALMVNSLIKKSPPYLPSPKPLELLMKSKLKGDHEASRRHLVFACATVAAADGFEAKERELLYKVGKTLGVEQSVVDGIVAGCIKENEGRLERLKYMGNQRF